MKPERTKEEILRKSFEKNVFGMYGNKLSFRMSLGKDGKNFDWIYEAMEEYRQSSPVESRDAFAMKFLEYASGLAVSNYKSGGNWYLSDGRIVKTADILKQFKSELPIEETKEK